MGEHGSRSPQQTLGGGTGACRRRKPAWCRDNTAGGCPQRPACSYGREHRSGGPGTRPFKTKMCRFFEAEGKCPYGTDCTFAHTPQELQVASARERRRTRPCLFFFQVSVGTFVVLLSLSFSLLIRLSASQEGYCEFGEHCYFLHKLSEDMLTEKGTQVARLVKHSRRRLPVFEQLCPNGANE